jgi:peptidoglycan/LPS O-acetylase OafA/YrhL
VVRAAAAYALVQWQWNWRWALWPAYLGNYARFLFLGLAGDPYRFDRITFGTAAQHWFGSPMHLYIGHFWSLCIEEQFYLVWPFVVYKVRRRETLIKICLSVIVLMPLVRWLLSLLISPQMVQMELFYRSLPTRLDALLIGGLIALCLRGPEHEWLQRWRQWLLAGAVTAFAVLCIVAEVILHLPLEGSATNWVAIFGFTLIDLVAAGIILEAIHPGSALGRTLSVRPLRSLGVISYGFYVYHDLLHDFFAYFGNRFSPNHAFVVTTISAFAGSIAVAFVSYRALEKPFLKLKNRFTSQVHKTPSL